MDKSIDSCGNSGKAENMLRSAAVWAATCAEAALPAFETPVQNDFRPREAIAGGREFGHGKRRDKLLRSLAWAAHAAAKECDIQSAKYAARAAMMVAAIAYTHTDLTQGQQGVRQARHILGPAVYAALACEAADAGEGAVATEILRRAADSAPPEVLTLLRHMPTQPNGTTRLSQLFHELDKALRNVSVL